MNVRQLISKARLKIEQIQPLLAHELENLSPSKCFTESLYQIASLPSGFATEELFGITTNSTSVQEGYLFIALKGATVDAHSYIKNVLQTPHTYVIANLSWLLQAKQELPANYFQRVFFSPDPNALITILCKTFYEKLPQNLVAVTGTNGKTSVSSMVCDLLNSLEIKNAKIGTLGTFFNNTEVIGPSLTTPTTCDLYQTLSKAAASNINYAALECSSEGVALGRLGQLKFKVAVFTNLTQDHLNFHKTMDNYFAAKSSVFTEHLLKDSGVAVINTDDTWGKKLKAICEGKSIATITYGNCALDKGNTSDQAMHIRYTTTQDGGCVLSYRGEQIALADTNLVGFQLSNLCGALGALLALKGATFRQLVGLVPLAIKSVPGRLEKYKDVNGASIYIDYAHTPDALSRALEALKGFTKGNLYVVFGCGGGRDKGKRPLMGAAADKLADFTYITDDNPRFEDPQTIREETASGFNSNRHKCVEGREAAVKLAVLSLNPGDTLLLAGKGPEGYQIIGSEKIPMREKDLVDLAIAALKITAGPRD